MDRVQLTVQTVVGVATVVGGTALAVRLGRVRSSAATALRSVVMVLVAATITTTAATVSVDGPAWLSGLVPTEVVKTLTVGLVYTLGVPWLVFAFRYTGRGRLLTPSVRGGLAFVAAGTIVARFVLGVDAAQPRSVGTAASALLSLSVRGLLLAAVVIVVWESIGDTATPPRQGVGLGIAALLPFLLSVFPGPSVIKLGASVAVLAVVVRVFDPFGRLPAAE
ncbi:MAG: hypothetical protein J07HB67_00648, partial [halophilic archaeon J07HB67]